MASSKTCCLLKGNETRVSGVSLHLTFIVSLHPTFIILCTTSAFQLCLMSVSIPLSHAPCLYTPTFRIISCAISAPPHSPWHVLCRLRQRMSVDGRVEGGNGEPGLRFLLFREGNPPLRAKGMILGDRVLRDTHWQEEKRHGSP